MTTSSPPTPRLQAAKPDLDEGRVAFAASAPWKWIGGVLAAIALGFGAYTLQRKQEADELHRKMGRRLQAVAPLGQRFSAFRALLETWTLERVEQRELAPMRDERLRFDALGRAPGLYLRVRARDVHAAADLSTAARRIDGDSMASCLGLAPINAATMFDLGAFLAPEWKQTMEAESDVLRLRVHEEQLNNRLELDVPRIATLLEAQWFLLVVERAPSENERGPVDAYVWDLRRRQQLLAVRTEPRGVLLTVRTRVGGISNGPGTSRPAVSEGGDSCSVASQIRAAAGEDSIAEVGAVPNAAAPEPAPTPSVPIAAPPSAPAASAATP